MMTFADKILAFHFQLDSNWNLPPEVELLYPFDNEDTKAVMQTFFKKYFDDNRKRHLIFGINPGRFGAGITGTPFTDPKILEEECQIENPFQKRYELSAIFVYDFIKAFGTIEEFYQHFYITSLCPLGFVKAGKNYNYYDNKDLQFAVEPQIIKNIEACLAMGCYTDKAICMGQGKNYKYFKDLNSRKGYFEEIIPLPHPRWVMQYRRKEREMYVEVFKDVLDSAVKKG